MAEGIKPPRTFKVSQNSKYGPINSKGATRSRVLTGNSGMLPQNLIFAHYFSAAADYFRT